MQRRRLEQRPVGWRLRLGHGRAQDPVAVAVLGSVAAAARALERSAGMPLALERQPLTVVASGTLFVTLDLSPLASETSQSRANRQTVTESRSRGPVRGSWLRHAGWLAGGERAREARCVVEGIKGSASEEEASRGGGPKATEALARSCCGVCVIWRGRAARSR
ncbi:hypothetical protein BD289DRAFT_448995 [Coniella lustricola]|uniref:Uncharacterized protein n=1 Tax=Coniella lustricola TaxID=2025994 RepID=A0A2T2ZRK5_9PEZI|nr:hypothetical protein BD289DRAFT_448995 [Coniella lustricola]